MMLFIKKLISSWNDNRIASLSAALAFYMLFALAPILLISISIAGLILGSDAAQGHILMQISDLVGSDVALEIQTMIKNANRPITAAITNLIGIIVLIFAASGLFSEIQNSLNIIWNVKTTTQRGLLSIIKNRFLSFLMLIVVAFFLLTSMLLTTLFTTLSEYIAYYLGHAFLIKLISSDAISFLITVLVFATIFKVLPEANIKWREVWLGAFVTAVMFTIGKFLLALYISKMQVGLIFGTSGSIIVILIWTYYSAQIFFIGAEITQIFATRKLK